MKTIEFNLDTYKRIVSGELIGSVQTRRGTKVYVQRINGEGNYPIIAQPEGSAAFYTYTIDGRIRANIDNEDDMVIILKEKVMETKYVKVPFDMEQAKKITSCEIDGRIVTQQGESVRILCWDKKDKEYPIVGLVDGGTEEYYKSYTNEGVWNTDKTCAVTRFNLMLEIPEYMTFKDGDIIAYDDNDSIVILKGEPIVGDDGFVSFNFYVDMYRSDLNFYSKKVSLCVDNARKATPEEIEKLKNRLEKYDRQEAREYLKRFFGIEQKQKYEFKPKDWVLCRNGNEDWYLCRFSHVTVSVDRKLLFVAVGGIFYSKCIPYNDQTAHLLGTTENWEE